MNKNELVTVQIEDFTREGEGIGRADGYTLFVKDAVIGDTVVARITRPKKAYAYARLEEILTPSPWRVRARCPEARRCGGCRLQEYAYDRQLLFKHSVVENALRRIGGFADIEVRPVLGMDTPYRYRNKAQYPVAQIPVRKEKADHAAKSARKSAPGDFRIEAGFYAGRTHSLIPVRDCLLTRSHNAEILETFLGYMRENHVSAYDEATGRGLVRHLLIREGFSSGEILVCPVINGTSLPKADRLVKALCRIPGVSSVCLNCNQKRGNVILGDETLPLYGEPWITDTLGGMTFRISPRSFYQVNPVQTDLLYSEALRATGLTGNETVYDLYCGIGTISLYLAQKAREVYGVEIIPDAVRDAQDNARRNGISNAHFFVGAAEDLVASGEFAPGVPCPAPDVVVLDPPRKGCDPALIRAVLQMKPDRIVYVSCDPATLARDLRLFAEGDGRTSYHPVFAQPVDMFPQTVHVETVCLLELSFM